MKDTSLSARRALRESASGYAFILPQMIGFFLFVLQRHWRILVFVCSNNDQITTKQRPNSSPVFPGKGQLYGTGCGFIRGLDLMGVYIPRCGYLSMA